MRESGYYPPGAEFDPRAPYNQKDDDIICPNCKEFAMEDDEPVDYEQLFTCDECGKEEVAISESDQKGMDYEDAMESKYEQMKDDRRSE